MFQLRPNRAQDKPKKPKAIYHSLPFPLRGPNSNRPSKRYCHEDLFKVSWARDLERLVVSLSGPLPEGIYILISTRLLTTHLHSLG